MKCQKARVTVPETQRASTRLLELRALGVDVETRNLTFCWEEVV